MRPRTQWLWQALSGLLLVVLLLVHLSVNHFVAHGLLTYDDVVFYLSHGWSLVIEILFLVTVIYHALAGVRAIVLDLGVSPETAHRWTMGLIVLGLVMGVYGLWLFSTLL